MDACSDKKFDAHLEKAMFSLWLKESGETNDAFIDHLKKCIHVAMLETLTEKQKRYVVLYLNGFNSVEIAEICGKSVSCVSRTINRGLDNIVSRIKYATPRTLLVEHRVRKRLTRLYGCGRPKYNPGGDVIE